MKIINNLEGLYKPETFKQKDTRIQADDAKESNTVAPLEYGQQKTDPGKFSLKKVLSVNEINSLSALFGYEQDGRDALYGRNNIRNVHAGMLLDVKG